MLFWINIPYKIMTKPSSLVHFSLTIEHVPAYYILVFSTYYLRLNDSYYIINVNKLSNIFCASSDYIKFSLIN